MDSYEEEQRSPETFRPALADESMKRVRPLTRELYLEKRNEKKKGLGSSSDFDVPDDPEEFEQMILKFREKVDRYFEKEDHDDSFTGDAEEGMQQAPEEDPHRSGDETGEQTGADQSSSGESEPSTETHANPSGYLPNDSNAEEAEGGITRKLPSYFQASLIQLFT